MTERGLEGHELKAFGLFRQAKDPEWPPAPANNAERESEWPSQPRAKRGFYYLSGQSIELNQTSLQFDLFLEAHPWVPAAAALPLSPKCPDKSQLIAAVAPAS
jgi:hypothetical protein